MIAVTGAAGFIGSNLAHQLAALGHDLLLVDHPLTTAKPANWVGLERFSFLTHEAFLRALATNELHPQAIFHLGACSSTTETNWEYLQRNNIGYTQTLWQWCVQHACPYIYASSAATYGDGQRGFSDRTPPADLVPLNLYGRSKNDFDAWVLQQQATPPRWAGMKFFNVYGPREAHKGSMASMVYHAHRQIKQTGLVRLFKSNDPTYADGGQLRDFVFVGDVVAHMLWLWQNDHPGGVYNSGTGTPRSFTDLAKAVFTALHREPMIEYIPMPEQLAKQYQNFTQADLSKLRAAGCTLPATLLEDGVQQTITWLEKQ